jgi:hypothetical protein
MIDHRQPSDQPVDRPPLAVDHRNIDPFSLLAAAGRIPVIADLVDGAEVIPNRMPGTGIRWHVLLPRKGDATMRYARMPEGDGTILHRFECSSMPGVLKDCSVAIQGPPMDPDEIVPTIDTASFARDIRLLASGIADVVIDVRSDGKSPDDSKLAEHVAERMQEDFPKAMRTFDGFLRITRYPTLAAEVAYVPRRSNAHKLVPVLKPSAAAMLPDFGDAHAALEINENGISVDYVFRGVTTIVPIPERTGDVMRRLRLVAAMPMVGDAPWTDEFLTLREALST